MPYPALPDRRMPYDIDGTLVYFGNATDGAQTAADSTQRGEMNDDDQTLVLDWSSANKLARIYLFYPEQREVTGFWMQWNAGAGPSAWSSLTGSNDTTNGEDGTWETASLPSGAPAGNAAVVTFDLWRSGIKPISFTGPKKNVRFSFGPLASAGARVYTLQVYGEAAAGQMAHDLILINHDDTPGVEYTAPEDFGDQPLGTTVVRQFRVKNTSATETATNINIQLNDADFTLAEAPGGPWVVTINLASLAPGAESPTYYIRCTTPAPGAALKPRFARMLVTCDAGFFG